MAALSGPKCYNTQATTDWVSKVLGTVPRVVFFLAKHLCDPPLSVVSCRQVGNSTTTLSERLQSAQSFFCPQLHWRPQLVSSSSSSSSSSLDDVVLDPARGLLLRRLLLGEPPAEHAEVEISELS